MLKKTFRAVLVIAMTFSLVCPQSLQAAQGNTMVVEGISVSNKAVDVALQDTAFIGSIVDSAGKPLAGMVAVVTRQGKVLDVQETNADGIYQFANLAPGVYQVGTEAGIETCRVWEASAAPDQAVKGLIQVASEDDVIRGSHCADPGCDGIGGRRFGRGGRLAGIMSRPGVVGLAALAIAAAIAIPLALDRDSS